MADLQVFNCEQGTPEWYEARLGIPTASEFATVMAKGRDGGASLTRKTYMMKLAGERLTGQPMDSYSNGHMERGKEWEAEAREQYAFEHEADPQIVGFLRRGDMGCSPDSLIGERGGLEIKTKAAHLHIEALLRDDIPPEHRAQLQGFLLVTEREWIDLAIYCRKLPLVTRRVSPDRDYIANLKGEIDRFNDELAAMVERVRTHGAKAALAA
ncbi:lambda exonuclease family protein [Phenylobacterium kunshanense]|uniref:Exonuclease n=1 Tax=Phenylobacterium kunshanense TaxID=1445034 RepID=A0A328BUQ7_9CAUL|nr:lambda exonuclease family protein [Phenylobacterium kunshanense]RAK68778.1 exonuclease [Phenylobacterium kunshanense]